MSVIVGSIEFRRCMAIGSYQLVPMITRGEDDAIMLMRYFENVNERDDTGAKSILLESAKAVG